MAASRKRAEIPPGRSARSKLPSLPGVDRACVFTVYWPFDIGDVKNSWSDTVLSESF